MEPSTIAWTALFRDVMYVMNSIVGTVLLTDFFPQDVEQDGSLQHIYGGRPLFDVGLHAALHPSFAFPPAPAGRWESVQVRRNHILPSCQHRCELTFTVFPRQRVVRFVDGNDRSNRHAYLSPPHRTYVVPSPSLLLILLRLTTRFKNTAMARRAAKLDEAFVLESLTALDEAAMAVPLLTRFAYERKNTVEGQTQTQYFGKVSSRFLPTDLKWIANMPLLYQKEFSDTASHAGAPPSFFFLLSSPPKADHGRGEKRQCCQCFLLHHVVNQRATFISTQLEFVTAGVMTGMEPFVNDPGYPQRVLMLREETRQRAFAGAREVASILEQILKGGMEAGGAWTDARGLEVRRLLALSPLVHTKEHFLPTQLIFMNFSDWVSLIIDHPAAEEGGPPNFTYDAKLNDLDVSAPPFPFLPSFRFLTTKTFAGSSC